MNQPFCGINYSVNGNKDGGNKRDIYVQAYSYNGNDLDIISIGNFQDIWPYKLKSLSRRFRRAQERDLKDKLRKFDKEGILKIAKEIHKEHLPV